MTFPTTPVLDDFTGPAGKDVDFSTISATGTLNDVWLDGAGAAVNPFPNTGKYVWSYWNRSPYGPDAECYLTIKTRMRELEAELLAAADVFRVGVRVSQQGTAQHSGYYTSVKADGTWLLLRLTNGANNTMATRPGFTLVNVGDKIGVQAIGSVVSAWHCPAGGSWVEMLTYDTAADSVKYTAAGMLAIEFGQAGSELDDFGGGVYVPPSGGTGHTQNPADTLTATDRFTSARAARMARADTVTATDLFQASRGVRLALADSLTPADVLAFQESASLTLGDTLTITPGFSRHVDVVRELEDELALTDKLSRTKTGQASPAELAIQATLALLAEFGIEATRDAGAFYPQPVGVLVGLPTLVSRGLASRTYEIPVLVVSGDPLNTELAVNRLYALADDAAIAVRTDRYATSNYRGGVNSEPLPALELAVTVTIEGG